MDSAFRTGILRDGVARQVTKGRVREERSSEGQRAESEPYVDRDLALVNVVRQEGRRRRLSRKHQAKVQSPLSVSALQAPALISRSTNIIFIHHHCGLLDILCCNECLDLEYLGSKSKISSQPLLGLWSVMVLSLRILTALIFAQPGRPLLHVPWP